MKKYTQPQIRIAEISVRQFLTTSGDTTKIKGSKISGGGTTTGNALSEHITFGSSSPWDK